MIGAGIAGLCAAVRLARAGVHVTVLEKNDAPGGRCGRIREQGFSFDIGPTILLRPEVLAELWSHAGREMAEDLRVEAVSPNYKITYADGSELTLAREHAAMRRELERLEPGAGARYERFLAAGAAQLDAAMGRFAVTHYDGLRAFASPGTARALLASRAYRSLASHVARYFRDPRLQMAFSFQTMYLGLSPYDAPAIYGLLPYTELANGVFYTRGGLYQIPLALERLARSLGVVFEYGREVTRLVARDGRIAELELDGHERRACDVVLANADLPWVYAKLLGPEFAARAAPTRRPFRYTSSAFMLYLGLDTTYPELLHHNVFFGARFRESFDEIFRDRVVPADVSFYAAAPSRTDPSVAPPGCTALYVLVPVPHQGPRVDWRRAEEPLRARVLDRLEATVAPGLRRHIVLERRLNPDGWAAAFNLMHGSAFGLAHTLDQVGPFRPRNRDPALENLYFCGASTQPGTGIPLVAISARLVVERILREQQFAVSQREPTEAPAGEAAREPPARAVHGAHAPSADARTPRAAPEVASS